MDQGEPDDRSELKESPHDFALWKAQKPEEDTAWDAPWGRGRPGWHIECSAMAEEILGLDFDVHGGGVDLIFPHHENEIAQTEAGRGRPLARLWMHNGIVRLGGEKMAKSVGNIRSLAGALDEYGRDAVVMYFVSGRYREPVAFSADELEQAANSVERVRDLIRRLDRDAPGPDGLGELEARFYAALAEDFNTPGARAALFDWVAEANRRLDAGESFGPGELAEMLRLLGLETLLEVDDERPPPEAIRLLQERQAARATRDFELADQKRDRLAELGWQVRDTPDGQRLVRRT
jgi:cysteinyl-tRNA synthetase